MTGPRFTTMRSAWRLLTVRFLLRQMVFALVVAGLFVAWLRIPDSRVVYVITTVLFGLSGLAFALGGEAWMLLRLAGKEATRTKVLRGSLILLVAVLLWLLWHMLIAHLQMSDDLRAGYLNSQSPRTWRGLLSYRHLLTGFQWGWTLLESIGSAVLAAAAFGYVVSAKPGAAVKGALRCRSYWVVFLFATTWIASGIWELTQWTPGHGLGVEVLSLALRLSAAVMLSGLTVSFVLAVLAACVIRAEGIYEIPAGTPVESQLRTADNP